VAQVAALHQVLVAVERARAPLVEVHWAVPTLVAMRP
jgi:hypothetical protein